MTLLSFPDVNVWLAIILEHHEHHAQALAWWEQANNIVAFMRLTQLSVLRLLTTPAVMDGQPLSMAEAWQAYDRLFEDDRVSLYPEPAGVETQFRLKSQASTASPKVWADAYLVAFVAGYQGQLVTFDQALEDRGANCLLLQ